MFVDRLLATLVHLRHGATPDVLACWFGLDRSTITRAVDEVRPLLAEQGCTVSPDVRNVDPGRGHRPPRLERNDWHHRSHRDRRARRRCLRCQPTRHRPEDRPHWSPLSDTATAGCTPSPAPGSSSSRCTADAGPPPRTTSSPERGGLPEPQKCLRPWTGRRSKG
ncbi:transposase family protein [Streptomyces sp. NPDC006259]|uniref:helix-turn-helix domain-containing protein n=1 Tax=Streptomyces sp. NPDC006259 TaxID=3364740 RepID=UPI0036B3BE22